MPIRAARPVRATLRFRDSPQYEYESSIKVGVYDEERLQKDLLKSEALAPYQEGEYMKSNIFLLAAGLLFFIAGYTVGNRGTPVARAASSEGVVPKSYGRLVTAIPDQIGTGLVFEDKDGVVRFVSVTGMKEGQLARYEDVPTHGGIPNPMATLLLPW